MSRSRRALLGSAAAIAPLLIAGVATASNTDADLVAMAAELRAIEAAYNEGCRGPDEWTETPKAAAMLARLEDLIAYMSEIPAVGMAGIAAKAGRLCFSLHPRSGGMLYCEDVLVASLAADLARLVPHAVGAASAASLALPLPGGPDAELLRLAKAWRVNIAEHEYLAGQVDAAEDNPADEARLLLAFECNADVNHDLDARIAVLPAQTWAGIRAKATIAECYGLADRGAIERSLLDDLLRPMGCVEVANVP